MIRVVFKGRAKFFGMEIQRTVTPAGADEATFVDDLLVIKRNGSPISMIPRENVEQVIFDTPSEQV
jgi:hypothetical protein